MVLRQLARREGFEDDFDARAAHLTAKQRAATLHVLEALTRSEHSIFDREEIDTAIASWRAVQHLPDPAPAGAPPSSPPAPPASEPARSTVGRMPSATDVDPVMAELLDTILQAFPPTPFPPDLLADPTERWHTYLRAREFEDGIQGHTWSTLIPEFVEIHHWALAYMLPDAFAALVPAYLARLIRGGPFEAGSIIEELTRRERWDEDMDSRATRLTGEQRAVIVRVLEALAGVEDLAEHRPHIDAALARWRAPSTSSPT